MRILVIVTLVCLAWPILTVFGPPRADDPPGFERSESATVTLLLCAAMAAVLIASAWIGWIP
jgi:hypothetical protein